MPFKVIAANCSGLERFAEHFSASLFSSEIASIVCFSRSSCADCQTEISVANRMLVIRRKLSLKWAFDSELSKRCSEENLFKRCSAPKVSPGSFWWKWHILKRQSVFSVSFEGIPMYPFYHPGSSSQLLANFSPKLSPKPLANHLSKLFAEKQYKQDH